MCFLLEDTRGKSQKISSLKKIADLSQLRHLAKLIIKILRFGFHGILLVNLMDLMHLIGFAHSDQPC